MAFDTPPVNNEGVNKFNYLTTLQSIERNNGNLKVIAQKFLTRPDLLSIVKATTDKNFRAYGVNSIDDTDSEKIKIKGITLNPEHITEELVLHELVHFFSMPALRGAFNAQQKNEFNNLAENVKIYWLKTKALWDFVKSKEYSATNTHSMSDDIVEFAVNFTNKQSEEKLKSINAYNALVDSFFEYYNSIKIKE